jgi:hypothetical protein
MSKRIVTAVALLGAAGFVSGCSIEQPSAGCIVQDATDAPWQAVYILKNPADASKSCGQLQGEALGVFKFVNPYPDQHPGVPASRLAIRPEGTASRFVGSYTYGVTNADGTPKIDPKTGKQVKKTVTEPRVDLESMSAAEALTVQQAATGMSASLADQPDDKGLCKASGFEPAKISASEIRNEVDSSKVEIPAENVSYNFGDVFVYSHPSAPGTQLEGSLTYTDDNCSAEYRVLALWPQIPCDPDAFANPTTENAADRCAEGSGLNPDFDAVCVAGIAGGDGGCVPNPAKGVPAFK